MPPSGPLPQIVAQEPVKEAHGNPVFKGIDLRLVMLGSMLPDIIDKPLGMLLFRSSLSSGRVWGHTLLFELFLLLLGFHLKRRGKQWLLVLAFSSLGHLALDEMWLYPKALFWPALGWGFEKETLSAWIVKIIQSLQTEPSVYIPEILGFAVMVTLVRTLVERKMVTQFLKKGLL